MLEESGSVQRQDLEDRTQGERLDLGSDVKQGGMYTISKKLGRQEIHGLQYIIQTRQNGELYPNESERRK